MKNLKSLFTLKSFGMVLVAAFALILSNYANASTPETAETIVTATMGMGAMRSDVFERGTNFIQWLIDENNAGNRNDFDAQFVKDYLQNKKVLHAFTYYIRKKIGTSGAIELIESPDKNVEGITNIGEGEMGKGIVLALTDLMLSYASSTTDVAADTLIYTNDIYDSTTQYAAGTVELAEDVFGSVAVQAVPTKLVNAELSIKNGEDVIAPQILCTDLFKNNRSGLAMPGNGALALKVPKLLLGELKTTATIRFPKGGAIAAAYNYVELKLIGVAIRNR